MAWSLAALEDLDDAHAAAAAGAWRGQRLGILAALIVSRVSGVVDIGRNAEKFARRRQALGLGATGEEPVMADAMKAPRKDMDEEATDELAGVERHGGVARRTL